ncbi:MAG: ribosome small subunit-dependent GTPase A [Burkholderiales bacterium]
MSLPRLHGSVVAAHGRRYRVELDEGPILDCLTRGKRSEIACGDRVQVTRTAPDQGVVEAADPRSTLLYRSDPYRQKLIAANVTLIVLVVAPVPSYHDELLNRCLVAAEHAGARALIVLNKTDLDTAAVRSSLAVYEAIGYPVVPLSARYDVSALVPHLAGETSVLVGQSGMGKSTLVNALVPEAEAPTREVSEALDSGKHTTTHARMYRLDARSRIIDSPGLQAFGLSHVPAAGLDHTFVELRPWIGRCRFANCRHLNEPGCAIADAVASGRISTQRLAAYRAIRLELSRQEASPLR